MAGLLGRRTAAKTALATIAATCALAFAPPSAAATTTAYDALEGPLVTKINQLRAGRGLPKLTVASRLTSAATRHASSMGRNGYFAHDLYTPLRAADWTPFSTWIRWYWPGPGYSSWSAGENLFCSTYTPTAREVVDAWMASPGHRAVLLTRGWRAIGVSVVQNAEWRGFEPCEGSATIVAAEFGRRS